MTWVKWDIICKSKSVGGLRVKDLRCFNLVFLGKWKWRLQKEGEGVWRDILGSKYESWKSLDEPRGHPNETKW